MKKILIVTGLTASGKTGLGIEISKMIGADIISADSRQVYKGMDIGTGKDVEGSSFVCVKKMGKFDIGYYEADGIKIWLLDIVWPNYKFSVSDYLKVFDECYKLISNQGRKVVVVGGSGFYVDSILNPKDSFELAPIPLIRTILNVMPSSIIKKIYKNIARKKFEKLNNSEKNNRHRLIRRIEKLFRTKKGKVEIKYEGETICLMAKADLINKKIDKRVLKRLENNLIEEVFSLAKKYGWRAFGLNCLAYKEFKGYFNKEKTLEECVSKWRQDEHMYAKRQITWFKKKKYKFVDIEKINYNKLAKNIVDGTIFHE